MVASMLQWLEQCFPRACLKTPVFNPQDAAVAFPCRGDLQEPSLGAGVLVVVVEVTDNDEPRPRTEFPGGIGGQLRFR